MPISFGSYFGMTYPRGLCFENFSSITKELVFFKNGSGTTTINGETYSCGKQSLCYTRPGDFRDQICREPMDYLCIRFTGADLPEEPATGVYKLTDSVFYSLFLDIQKETERKRRRFHTICSLKVSEILTYLDRELHSSGRDEDFYSLIQEIDTGRRFKMTIEEMADKVSCSPDHFRHKFKKITGTSPTEYLINRRIEYALELLALGRYNCTQVSELCGFSTPGQFSMVFKRKTGLSPKFFK